MPEQFKSVPAPQVSLGGTAKDVLLEQLSNVGAAIRAAAEAIAAAAPHARDYPDADKYGRALSWYRDDQLVLQMILDRHDTIAQRVADQ